MTFALYNASSGGAQVGSTVTDLGLGVTNGLFMVILDFGGVYNGTSYWLQIGVRTNGAVSYTPLTPRQQLTPTPYAITAENVDGPVSASQLSGTLGSGLFPIPLDLSGSTVVPLLESDQSGSGDAIFGNQTSTTGTPAGVRGTTASQSAFANGVFGLVSSTSPGGFSAGVRGQNNGTGGNGIGVYGSQAGGGWGVYGTAASGVGVQANGGTGTGVNAQGGTGMIAYGFTGDGLDAYSEATNGIAVMGSHTVVGGTAAGVQGTTASQDSGANGVYGVVSSTSPGGFSAGVRGQNNGTGGSGIGVYGSQAGGGWGVYGTTPSGIGVYGYSSTGTGVQGGSGSGTGVYAQGGTGMTAYGLSGDGIDASSEVNNGVGVMGSHVAVTGTAAGVQGTTSSQSSSANGVFGLVSSGSPGGFSAGVYGQNNGTNGSGIGVYGSQAGGGWGVYGTTPSGAGVYGFSSAGFGVQAGSSSGTGVYASSTSGSALTIGGGTIHVSGAGVGTSTAAFIHRATAAITAGDSTTINNSQCNGDPNAILIVTQNWNPGGSGGVYNTHHVGVWYNGSNWAIFNEDGTTMVTNCAYNVLVIKN
jgi:hypothetical protein